MTELIGRGRLQCMASYMRVKICGVTNEADAVKAADLGVDAIGLNFYAKSPRCVDSATAKKILRATPPFVMPVGVFTDTAAMIEGAEVLGLTTVQWHGNPTELSGLPSSEGLKAFHIIVAFRIADIESLEKARHWLEQQEAVARLPMAILMDSHRDGLPGGTGHVAPWNLLADFRSQLPLILGGGLTPENVAEAVSIVRPWGVDVASGVEKSPGVKDPEKMKRFIENAREAGER